MSTRPNASWRDGRTTTAHSRHQGGDVVAPAGEAHGQALGGGPGRQALAQRPVAREQERRRQLRVDAGGGIEQYVHALAVLEPTEEAHHRQRRIEPQRGAQRGVRWARREAREIDTVGDDRQLAGTGRRQPGAGRRRVGDDGGGEADQQRIEPRIGLVDADVPDERHAEASRGQAGVEGATTAVSVHERDPLAREQSAQPSERHRHHGQRPRPHRRQRDDAHGDAEPAQLRGHLPLGGHRGDHAQAAVVEGRGEAEQALLAAPHHLGEVGEQENRGRLRRLVGVGRRPAEPARQLRQPHGVDEHDEGGHRTQHEAVPALAEPLLDDELAHEEGRGLEDERPHGGERTQARPAAAQHAGVVARVQEQLAHVVGQRVVAAVQQVLGEIAHGAVDDDLLVDQRVVEAAPVAAKEAEDGARVPAAVMDEAAQVGRQPRHPKPDAVAGRGHRRLDRPPQRRRHHLVGVEAEDPRPGRLGDREPLLLAEAGHHVTLDHPRAVLAADGGRLVATVLVDDDDLVGPADAVQAGADARGLVAGDEHHRDRRPLSHR